MLELPYSVCLPKQYRSLLGVKETQIAIKKLKDFLKTPWRKNWAWSGFLLLCS